MRRVTFWEHDHDKAHEAVVWLSAHGYDVMAEDYAEPTIRARRDPPERRSPPDRADPAPGFLKPLKKPSRPGKLSDAILTWLTEAGRLHREEIRNLAKDAGFKPDLVKDTLRRMVKSKKVLGLGYGGVVSEYALPAE